MKPIATEKAVMKIELENVLTFEFEKRLSKAQIAKEIEEMFNVKVENVRTQTRGNKKIAYAKLNPKNLAIDVATKMGLM